MTGLSGLWFVLTTLAVWRSVVFIRQDGLIEATRSKVNLWLMRRNSLITGKLIYLLGCQWCLSIWFAALATLAWSIEVDFTWVSGITTWLALAAAASITDLVADHL